MPIIEFSNLNKYGTMRTRRFYHPTTNYGLNPEGLAPWLWLNYINMSINTCYLHV